MSDNHEKARAKLERLSVALTHDVDELSDQALFKEAEDSFGNSKQAIAAARGVINAAFAEHGKQRLNTARQGYADFMSKTHSTVIELSLPKKRALVEQFTRDDPALREKLTMAARNENDHAADIDSFLEDLVELGVVDDQGNLQ